MRPIYLKILFVGFLFFCCIKSSYAQELTFQYDQAGNQTVRQFVCVNCSVFPVSLTTPEVHSQTTSRLGENKNNALTNRKLVAYPNPLTEVLNVVWRAEHDIYVKTLEVYSPVGAKVFQGSYYYSELYTQSISFLKQAPGMYILRATYSDGKQEVIKVIKK